MTSIQVPSAAIQVFDRGWVKDKQGNELSVIGSVSPEECQVLHDLVIKNQVKTVVETGIAREISSLAICEALSKTDGKLYGIDPCQGSEHNYAAVETLREFGFHDRFELTELGSEVALPQLYAQKFKCDMVFIDGIHRFLERSVDYLYADRMLRIGGILAFHDLHLPSMKKVLKMIRTHGTYELVQTPTARPSIPRRVRLLAGAIFKRRPSCLWWPNRFSNLLVLKKKAEFDGDFLWHRNF